MQRNNILRQTKAHDWPSEGAHPLGFTSSSCTSCLHHRLCFRWVLHIQSNWNWPRLFPLSNREGCLVGFVWVYWVSFTEWLAPRQLCLLSSMLVVGSQGCDEGHKQGTRWHLFLSSSLCSTCRLGGSPSGPWCGPWSPELVQLLFWGHQVTLEWPHHMWHTDTCLLCWQERQKICNFWSS